MPRAQNFNEGAMELKIKKNLERGFTMRGILGALLEESLDVQNKIINLESRGAELSDQIDYVKEKYFPRGINNEGHG